MALVLHPLRRCTSFFPTLLEVEYDVALNLRWICSKECNRCDLSSCPKVNNCDVSVGVGSVLCWASQLAICEVSLSICCVLFFLQTELYFIIVPVITAFPHHGGVSHRSRVESKVFG